MFEAQKILGKVFELKILAFEPKKDNEVSKILNSHVKRIIDVKMERSS